MKKFLVIFFIIFTFWSCGPMFKQEPHRIRMKGSDTMLQLAFDWAGKYMEEHPGTSIYVEGGGTATGFKALTEGTIDIAMASRVINSHEARLLSEKHQHLGVSFLAAKDALSIYLNPGNPVTDLNMQQLNAIFTGKITNWKTLGGIDAPIEVVLRPETSGTFYYLKSHILSEDNYTADALTLPTTKKVIEYVRTNRNAIGYGGIAFGNLVKQARINGVEANEENVRLFKYPLARYLYLYTIDKPQGEVKRFINWILGREGQKTVREIGFIPIWEKN